jgi:hypothetical protein
MEVGVAFMRPAGLILRQALDGEQVEPRGSPFFGQGRALSLHFFINLVG